MNLLCGLTWQLWAGGCQQHRGMDQVPVAPQGTACVLRHAGAWRVSLLEAAVLLLTPFSA